MPPPTHPTHNPTPPAPHAAQQPNPTLQAIAQATAATAAAMQQLVAVARFGPQAGAPGALGGVAGPAPLISGPKSAAQVAAQQFAAGQKQLAERADVLARLGFRGTASAALRVSEFAGGLKAAGMAGPAALAQRAALPLAVASGLANGAERFAGYAYDRYSTNEQIGRQIVRDVIPGGERAQQFVDAMSGRAAKMEQVGIDFEKRMAGVQQRLGLAQFNLGYRPQQAGYEAAAAAYRGQSAVAPSVFDRSTALGERSYREEQKVLPLKREEAAAERDLARATAERVGYAVQLSKLNERERALRAEAARLTLRLRQDDYQSGPERQELLKRRESLGKELEGLNHLQREAESRGVESARAEAGARGELEKARLRTRMLGQADVIEGRAQTAAGNARALGGMSPLDRAMNAQYAKLIADRGSVDGLPDFIVQGALSVAGNTVGKIVEQTGLKSREFQGLAADPRFAADYPGNPNDLQRQADTLRQKYAQGEFGVDARAAQQVADAGRELGDRIATLMEKFANETILAVERRVLIGRGQK